MNRSTRRRTQSIVRYSLLGTAIIVLALYLIFGGTDRISYTIPDLAAVERGDIDTISIRSEQNGPIKIKRKDERWLILPNEYEADSGAILAMVDLIADFELTDVVSEASYYERFDLDADSRYEVTVENEGNSLLKFNVGKRSPTFNHTYVTLPSDPRVFHATGNLLSAFQKGVDALRDKLVLSVNPENVLRIEVTSENDSFRLFKSVEEGVVLWTSSDGSAWNPETIGLALDRMRNLRSVAFVEDSQLDPGINFDRPAMSLEIVEEETHRLVLYAPSDSAYLAGSSQSPYTFTISTFQAEQILGAFSADETE